MKTLIFISLLCYTILSAIPSYAISNIFKNETLDYATKITLNGDVLTINHPECEKATSAFNFSRKQQYKETTITLECAGKSYHITQSDFIEKAAHKEVNLSDLVESK